MVIRVREEMTERHNNTVRESEYNREMTDRAGERKRERVALPQKTIVHSREGEEMRGTDEDGEREGWKREREG